MGKRIIKEKINEISVNVCDLCLCDLEPNPPANLTEDGYPICWGFTLQLKQWYYTKDELIKDFLKENPQFIDNSNDSPFHKSIELSLCPRCAKKIIQLIECGKSNENEI
ncbi:MAG: hypothetical protein KAX49_03710 [Halanaerobiales bacterium]|nr:hypothetical protein [Halanaerobiales bacterium]